MNATKELQIARRRVAYYKKVFEKLDSENMELKAQLAEARRLLKLEKQWRENVSVDWGTKMLGFRVFVEQHNRIAKFLEAAK